VTVPDRAAPSGPVADALYLAVEEMTERTSYGIDPALAFEDALARARKILAMLPSSAAAPCPHVRQDAEGSAYCTLAERAAPSGEPSGGISDEDVATLLTTDGKGKQAKREALSRIIAKSLDAYLLRANPAWHCVHCGAGTLRSGVHYEDCVLRATPAEPGASPPEALVEKWAALATSGDGRHPEAAETLARCAAELKGALAARSPAPAGDAPTCSECHGSGRTDSHVTGEVECSHCDGCGEDPAGDAPTAVVVAQGPVNADRIDWTNTAGDAPREDALRERDRMWSKAILAEGAEAINRITTRLLVLRAAVSPSPGTRAASEGEA
jgi:hypothetical protein